MTQPFSVEPPRGDGWSEDGWGCSPRQDPLASYTCFIQSNCPIFSNSKYKVTHGHIISG